MLRVWFLFFLQVTPLIIAPRQNMSRLSIALVSFALLQLVGAGEPQAPCPQGGADCLEGRSLGPTAEELSALGAGLRCPGLHDVQLCRGARGEV